MSDKKKAGRRNGKKEQKVELTEPSISNYDSRIDTYEHIHEVRKNIFEIVNGLIERSQNHDLSKLEDPEKDLFDKWTPVLRELKFGSNEYKTSLEKIAPALKHHYENNSHHPEFFEKNEIWKDIEGYEGFYQISNFGRIKSLERDVERKKMGNFSKEEMFRKPHLSPKGYLRIQLSKNGQSKNYFVHRLVANAFVENRCEDKFVNHISGDKKDNRASNLEWCTPSENLLHAYDNGLRKANIKYVVKCITLDIITEGCQKMEKELRDRGYDKASAAGIHRCINQEGAKHLDLEFEAYKINEYDYSFVDHMTLLDIIEMFCDWKAASIRSSDGNMQESMKNAKNRFYISTQLYKIFENTIKELSW